MNFSQLIHHGKMAKIIFIILAKESVPVFTNVNIRTEFIELHRRVAIPDTWEEMVKLVERFGLGSMDAMILNLFQYSTLGILLTADSDLQVLKFQV